MIDPATEWFKCAALKHAPTADKIYQLFDNHWLARYPQPKEIGFDNGSEFKVEFLELIESMGMKWKTSTLFNPPSNAILERVHANNLQTFDLQNLELRPEDPFKRFITASAYAIQLTFHTMLGASPAQLVFGRDMFLPVLFEKDWNTVREHKQKQINDSNTRENERRIQHDYQEGDYVTLEKPGIVPKLALPRLGPYKVHKVHNNGTVTIQKENYLTETVNIRQVLPFNVHEDDLELESEWYDDLDVGSDE